MSKIWRRLIYLTFFLIFFISAPLFIFYGLGYRYNFNSQTIEKSGAFFVKSYPRNANIFINGQKIKYKTPDQVVNVKPGKYLVEIKKDGFVDWHEELTINPGQTTFIEDVALFLINREKTDLGKGSEHFLINKNQNKYAYLINNELWLVNTETAKSLFVLEFDKKTELIDWSPDDQQLLLYQDDYFSFDIGQQKLKSLNIQSPDKIIWDNQNNNFIWYLKDQTLYRYNLALGTETKQMTEIDGFDLTGKFLITQNTSELDSQVTQWTKENQTKIRSLDNLNLGNLQAILADDQYFIVKLGAKLHIQRPADDLITIPASIVKIYGKYLLISDGHEIWLYDYNDDWRDIIERSSQIVADIAWHPNGSYFIDEINGLTTIFELDNRDFRNNVQLLENPLKKMYLFNKRGDKLYILTPEENFYLTIQ